MIIACVLFIISHLYIRWSTFPFEYRNIGSVYSGLWRRNVIYGTRTVTFKIKCALERRPCTKLIIARYDIIKEGDFFLNKRDLYIRILMVMTCITSGIGGICLTFLSASKTKYKSLLYIAGLILAFL